MQVHLLRHAIAEDPAPGMRDRDRDLTREGVDKLRAVLRFAPKTGIDPAIIASSPYLRARETARIAAEVLRCKDRLQEWACLTPESDPEAVWTEIRVHKDAPQLLLVGHQPLFSGLTAYLLGDRSLRIDFKKSAWARIDIDRFGPAPRGILKWMLPPKMAD